MDKYIGFYIDRPIGNNIFSYEDRENICTKTYRRNFR